MKSICNLFQSRARHGTMCAAKEGRKFFSGLAAKAVLTAALVALSPVPARSEVVDRIVAIINDSIITLSELNAASVIASEGAIEKKEGIATAEVKNKVLQSLIEQKLVKQAADKAGIDISEREIDNAIDDVKKQNNLTQDALMMALAREGLTVKQYREQLKEQIRQVKFINKEFRSKISVQKEDIEDYYHQHKESFYTLPSYRVGMIFLESKDPALQKRRLDTINEGLRTGEDFGKLATMYSDGTTAPAGGDLGYLKVGEMDKSLEAHVSKLKTGEISEPIITAEGVYIIKLADARAAELKPLDAVKDQIQDKLYKKIMDERFSLWLTEVKKYAHVDIRLQ